VKYVCDRKRHLVCLPYSVVNLHAMAEVLGIGRHWFHTGKNPHYDIPKRRVVDVMEKCEVVTTRKVWSIINGEK